MIALITVFFFIFSLVSPISSSYASNSGNFKPQVIRADELGFEVSFYSQNNMYENTAIKAAPGIKKIIGDSGLINQPVSVSTSATFNMATIAFDYDPAKLGKTQESDLRIFYFNPANRNLELVQNQHIDYENHRVYADVNHFSIYLLADINDWAKTWKDGLVKAVGTSKTSTGQRNPLDIAFILDSSTSMGPREPLDMSNDYENDLNNDRITQTKNAIDLLLDTDRATVIKFNHDATVLHGLSNHKNALKAAADQAAVLGNYTNMPAAFSSAINELENSPRKDSTKIIVFLTDGNNNVGTVDVAAIAARCKKIGARIDTIALGKADSALLKSISDSTGGDFYYASKSAELQGLYQQIGGSIGLTNDVDSDGDGIPDWVEENGYIVKGTLNKVIPRTDPLNDDTDEDDISDGYELGTVYYDPITKNCFVSPEPLVYGQPHNPYRSNPTIPEEEDVPPVNIDVSNIIANTQNEVLKNSYNLLLGCSYKLGVDVEAYLNNLLKCIVEKVEIYNITNEQLSDLLTGVVFGISDNYFLGIPTKLTEMINKFDADLYYSDNYYFYKGKSIVDAIAMASFAYATAATLDGAAGLLTASGGTESFAVALAPASGGTSFVGGSAVAVGELAGAGVLFAGSAISGVMAKHSAELLSADTAKLKELKPPINIKPRAPRRPVKNVVRKIDDEDGGTIYVMLDKAGKEVSVKYTPQDYPDFRPFEYKGLEGKAEVEIEYTGYRPRDFKKANELAGFKNGTPPGYTWHHCEDAKTMVLVESEIHDLFKHTGGFSIKRRMLLGF